MNAPDHRELLEKALHEIRRLRQERESWNAQVNEPIAVLGMACRFPGAGSPEELWQIAQQGQDCITRVPEDRWDATAYYHPNHDEPGKMVTQQAGFLKDIRGFDAALFGISPREAKSMDPQQRWLLELTWEALERAAIAPDSLYERPVGVFVGLSNLEYANLIQRSGNASLLDSHFGTGNSASIAAGRIAYAFGLKGPTFTIDTACSSSLVAIHLAVASLRRRECEMAVAGGVNALILPETFVHFSNARMLSPDGRCKPFSAQADGYGRAEGSGVMILKRLSDAIRNGDPIQAVVKGCAVNHDGRSAGLTAPNGPSQEAVIRSALQDAKLASEDIQWIESHGTGTPLGDPIECGAIARTYGLARKEKEPIYITAIKANIGHAEAAAGIAGFIHACQCLRERRLPPLLHLNRKSDHIPWPSLQFASEPVSFENQDKPLRAAVSSFGFSGTNAHIILEEYVENQSGAANSGLHVPSLSQELMVLSAKSVAALRRLASDMASWLLQNPQADWSSVCYTLQTGRNHFNHRLVVEADSSEAAIPVLQRYADGLELAPTTTHPIAVAYMQGKTIDWTALNAHSKSLRRLLLPTYPFEQVEYWLAASSLPKNAPSTSNSTVVEVLKSAWKWDDWKLASEHRLFGASVMPAVGWLESMKQQLQPRLNSHLEIQSIAFRKMFLLPQESDLQFQWQLRSASSQETQVRVFASDGTKDVATEEAFVEASLTPSKDQPWQGNTIEFYLKSNSQERPVTTLYEQLQGIGLDYGPAFQMLERFWLHEHGALGQLSNPKSHASKSNMGAKLGVLDSALHLVAAHAWGRDYQAQDATAFVPVLIQTAQWFTHDDTLPAWCYVQIQPSSESYAIDANVFLWDAHQRPIAQWLGVKFEGFSLPARETSLPKSSQEPPANPSNSRPTVESMLSLRTEERGKVLLAYLREELAKELEVESQSIAPNRPLAELGLDSLMVFRLSIQVESEFGFAIDSRALMGGLSLQELTESLLWKLESLSQTASAEQSS